MSTTPNAPRASWPEVIVSPATLAAFARYDRLSPEERARAARLISLTSCTIDQACAAIEAQRADGRA